MVTRSRLKKSGGRKKVSRLKRTPKKMQVYYSTYFKGERNPYMLGTAEPTEKGLKLNYGKLPVEFDYDNSLTVMQNLEQVFIKLNQATNPMATPEKQQWIRESKLHHTSMSVGDIVKVGSSYYITQGIGFKKLKLKGD